MSDRRPVYRPYFFEVYAVANLLILHWILMRNHGMNGAIASLPQLMLQLTPAAAAQLLIEERRVHERDDELDPRVRVNRERCEDY